MFDSPRSAVVPTPVSQARAGATRGASIALAVGVVCIGFSAIFVRVSAVPGPVSAFHRMLVASLILVPWWLARPGARPSRRDVLLIVAGGACFALDLALWNSAVMLTSAATSTLLANNAPLWVGVGSLLLFGERLPVTFWLGLLVALTGTTILVGADAWRELHLNTGDLLALTANVFYAGYLLITQDVRARVGTIAFTAISALACGSVLLAVNLVTGTRLTGFAAGTWAALLGLGLVTHVGGWLAINYALGHLRAAIVSASLLGQAVVTALLAVPLLGEGLYAGQLAGGRLVLAGIHIVNRRGVERRREHHG